MMAMSRVNDEEQRLHALHQSGSLDGMETHDFEFIVRAAARLCNVQQAFVAFIDRETVWIKASVDYLPFMELPRGGTYGDLALYSDEPVVIPDLLADSRTAEHPLTRSHHGFRMYAATSISTPDGTPIGVLSLLDAHVRTLNSDELAWLKQLGQQTSALVEWRRQRRQLESALLDQDRATRLDTLTGLPNRPWLMAKIDEECQRAERFGHPLALVLFDIDNLEAVNTELGRETGDAILARIGRMLRQSLRTTDTAGRLAGDRFCIVLPNTTAEGATTLAETLRGRVGRNQQSLEPAQEVTASFGVAATDMGYGSSGRHLLAATNAALEVARKSGRNRIVSAEPAVSQPPK